MEQRLPLVSKAQAQRLKATGFDWGVTAYYEVTGKYGMSLEHVYQKPTDFNNSDYGKTKMFSAPTVAEALKWARDVRFLDGHVEVNGAREYGWNYVLSYFERPRTYGSYKSHEEAESFLLDAVLDQIEKEEGVRDESAAVPG